jgi:hypothetical protein
VVLHYSPVPNNSGLLIFGGKKSTPGRLLGTEETIELWTINWLDYLTLGLRRSMRVIDFKTTLIELWTINKAGLLIGKGE